MPASLSNYPFVPDQVRPSGNVQNERATEVQVIAGSVFLTPHSNQVLSAIRRACRSSSLRHNANGHRAAGVI